MLILCLLRFCKLEPCLDSHTLQIRALDQLRAARGVLAFSYVFAYFFFGNDMYKVRMAISIV